MSSRPSAERASKRYNAILLDVDNGPTSFVQTKNARLYEPTWLAR